MGKQIRGGRGGRRKRRMKMSTNTSKNMKKRLKKAQNKKTNCSTINQVWDKDKTARDNLESMGLAYDVNKAINSVKKKAEPIEEMDMSQLTALRQKNIGTKPKVDVIGQLETEARQQRPTCKRLSEPQVLFCVRLIERYGDDYEAMARDAANHYQETAAQIKRKINVFKQSDQYNAYIRAKQ